MTGPLGVPDLPAAVTGWRTWRVGRRAQRRAELIAPLAGTPWPARAPMVASCASRGHTPPGDRCRCGLYAVADPAVLEWGPSEYEVLGVVALWGDVVEGARGWRASHGYPRLVVAGPGIAAEQRAALARRYGVPVLRSAIRLRALAALLGADRPLADRWRGHADEVEAALEVRMPEWVRRAEAPPPPPAGRARTTGRSWPPWRRRRPPPGGPVRSVGG